VFDSSKYVGEFKDGKRHGQGIFTLSDGSKEVGKFKNGNFVK
ncbi:MAG: 2-isopropylmalate synthase, partial [Flavobacteriaceae bacterium]|nr:2-isopropylmalate synthase [Flavobacteriaceae bacterium]